jgi:outer membrane autotransporter protein
LTFGKLVVLSAALSFFSVVAQAQWEAETDPAAYALQGFSVHLGHPIFDQRFRLQLGAFGAETPEWIHGNSGFTENSRGVTFKFDYFPLHRLSGLFLGADSNYSWVRYELNQTHEHVDRNIVGLGQRIGYRFNVGKHFYLSPWVSVDYQFNAKDVTISGKIFRESPYSVFPALHLGWTF